MISIQAYYFWDFRIVLGIEFKTLCMCILLQWAATSALQKLSLKIKINIQKQSFKIDFT